MELDTDQGVERQRGDVEEGVAATGQAPDIRYGYTQSLYTQG